MHSLAAAQDLAREGAKVYVTGLRQAELDAAVSAIGHAATGVQGDVTLSADLDALMELIREREGRPGRVAVVPHVARAYRPSCGPGRIAKVVTFLASDDSSFINGAEIVADGGQAQV